MRRRSDSRELHRICIEKRLSIVKSNRTSLLDDNTYVHDDVRESNWWQRLDNCRDEMEMDVPGSMIAPNQQTSIRIEERQILMTSNVSDRYQLSSMQSYTSMSPSFDFTNRKRNLLNKASNKNAKIMIVEAPPDDIIPARSFASHASTKENVDTTFQSIGDDETDLEGIRYSNKLILKNRTHKPQEKRMTYFPSPKRSRISLSSNHNDTIPQDDRTKHITQNKTDVETSKHTSGLKFVDMSEDILQQRKPLFKSNAASKDRKKYLYTAGISHDEPEFVDFIPPANPSSAGNSEKSFSRRRTSNEDSMQDVESIKYDSFNISDINYDQFKQLASSTAIGTDLATTPAKNLRRMSKLPLNSVIIEENTFHNETESNKANKLSNDTPGFIKNNQNEHIESDLVKNANSKLEELHVRRSPRISNVDRNNKSLNNSVKTIITEKTYADESLEAVRKTKTRDTIDQVIADPKIIDNNVTLRPSFAHVQSLNVRTSNVNLKSQENSKNEEHFLNQSEIDRVFMDEMKAKRTNPPVRRSTMIIRPTQNESLPNEDDSSEDVEFRYPNRHSNIPLAIHSAVPFGNDEKSIGVVDLNEDNSLKLTPTEIIDRDERTLNKSNNIVTISSENISIVQNNSLPSENPENIISVDKNAMISSAELKNKTNSSFSSNVDNVDIPNKSHSSIEIDDRDSNSEPLNNEEILSNKSEHIATISSENISIVQNNSLPNENIISVDKNATISSAELKNKTNSSFSSNIDNIDIENKSRSSTNIDDRDSNSEPLNNDEILNNKSEHIVTISSENISIVQNNLLLSENPENVISVDKNAMISSAELKNKTNSSFSSNVDNIDIENKSHSSAKIDNQDSDSEPLNNEEILSNKSEHVNTMQNNTENRDNLMMTEGESNMILEYHSDEHITLDQNESDHDMAEYSNVTSKTVIDMETTLTTNSCEGNTNSAIVQSESVSHSSEKMFSIRSSSDTSQNTADNSNSFSIDSLENDKSEESAKNIDETTAEQSSHRPEPLPMLRNNRNSEELLEKFKGVNWFLNTPVRREPNQNNASILIDTQKPINERIVRRNVADSKELEAWKQLQKVEEEKREKRAEELLYNIFDKRKKFAEALCTNNVIVKNKPINIKKDVKKTATKSHNDVAPTNAYKTPKLFMKESWITNRLYRFVQQKLEPKYNIKTRNRSEKFVKDLASIVNEVIKSKVDYYHHVNTLKNEMARLKLVETHMDFYRFVIDYLPFYFRLKAVPGYDNYENPTEMAFDTIRKKH